MYNLYYFVNGIQLAEPLEHKTCWVLGGQTMTERKWDPGSSKTVWIREQKYFIAVSNMWEQWPDYQQYSEIIKSSDIRKQ